MPRAILTNLEEALLESAANDITSAMAMLKERGGDMGVWMKLHEILDELEKVSMVEVDRQSVIP